MMTVWLARPIHLPLLYHAELCRATLHNTYILSRCLFFIHRKCQIHPSSYTYKLYVTRSSSLKTTATNGVSLK